MIKKKPLPLKKLRVWRRIILASLVTCIVFSMIVQTSYISLADSRKSEIFPSDPFAVALDEKMPDWLSEYKVPGAVVSYVQDGAVVWTRAFGVADIATGVPMREDNVFCTASASKALTAWGVMHLIEQGKLDLDTPVDRYLKRWHLPPSQFDSRGVTIRRVLSHTAGLTVNGYAGYYPRRFPLPTLEEVLNGQNQGNGAVEIGWEPGSGYHYSGGGYTVLQMVIEDVTDEPFADYMKREILAPLGMTQGDWTWNPVLKENAPTPYGFRGDDVMEYRTFATLGIGNYVSSVPDYARFLAMGVTGPNDEPPGRGLLKPETIELMMTTQPNSGGYGFGYATVPLPDGTKLISHGGASDGWVSWFALAPEQRTGFVFAAASDLAQPLRYRVHDLWVTVALGKASGVSPELLLPTNDPGAALVPIPLIVAGVLGVFTVWSARGFWIDIRTKRRRWLTKLGLLSTVSAGIWTIFLAGWIYFFHTSLPLWLPPNIPDIRWPSNITWVTITLVACFVLSLIKAFCPKKVAS